MTTLARALRIAEQRNRNRETGQNDLFAGAAPTTETEQFEEIAPWSEAQRLEGEKETLGFYLTGHPIERYASELRAITDTAIADLKPTQDRTVVVAGLVVGTRTMRTRRGDRMMFVTLDDRSGRLEIAVFSELYGRHRDILIKDNLLVVEGFVSVDEYTGGFKMSAEKIYNLDQARCTRAARLVIDMDAEVAANGFAEELRRILQTANGGRCPVYVHYHGAAADAEIALGEEWSIHPTGLVLERLSELTGPDRVRVVYQ